MAWTYEIAPNGYHVKDAHGIVRAVCRKSEDAHLLCKTLAELKRIAARIDKASGSPTFTSDEHDKLAALIAAAGA